jgi:hypothetical protein
MINLASFYNSCFICIPNEEVGNEKALAWELVLQFLLLYAFPSRSLGTSNMHSQAGAWERVKNSISGEMERVAGAWEREKII